MTEPVEEATHPAPYDIPCPTCDAQPGDRCHYGDPNGRKRPHAHATRRGNPKPFQRPPLLTPELQTELTTYLEQGTPYAIASQAVGIHPSTFWNWMARGQSEHPDDTTYRELRDAVIRARHKGAAEYVRAIHRSVWGGYTLSTERRIDPATREEVITEKYADMKPVGAQFMLERGFPQDFGRRQTLEIGPVDPLGPVEDALPSGVDPVRVERLLASAMGYAERRALEDGGGGEVVDGEVVSG